MIKTYTLKPGQKPTAAQLAEIEEAAKYPIVYDEDCPPLTSEQIEEFKRAGAVRRARAKL